MIFVGMIFLIVFGLKMCGVTDEAYFIMGNSNTFYIMSIIIAFAVVYSQLLFIGTFSFKQRFLRARKSSFFIEIIGLNRI